MNTNEKMQAIRKEIAKFPAEFSLRAFPGEKFKIVESQSYMEDGKILLYVYGFRNGEWLAFAKGTPEELQAQIVK